MIKVYNRCIEYLVINSHKYLFNAIIVWAFLLISNTLSMCRNLRKKKNKFVKYVGTWQGILINISKHVNLLKITSAQIKTHVWRNTQTKPHSNLVNAVFAKNFLKPNSRIVWTPFKPIFNIQLTLKTLLIFYCNTSNYH